MAARIPSVRGLPVLGKLRQFRKDRLALFMEVYETCGEIGAYRLGWLKFILINSPELAHQVLVEHADDFDKSSNFRTFAKPVLGNGLLTSLGAFHQRQRRLLAPAFQSQRVGVHAGVISGYAARMSRNWKDGEDIDIQREMVRLTLWIVGKTMFGADLLSEADDLGAALTDAIHGFNSQVSALLPLTIEYPTPANIRYRRAVRLLNRTVSRLIADRRAGGKDHGDLLSMLLLARYDDGLPMSDEQIRDEAMNMFMPGHETSATALTWAWHLLSQHPAIYARLLDEVDREWDDEIGGFPSLARLPYTLQVFKEALRLYPPVYMFTRQALRDVAIGDYHLPAGSLVCISPYAMHRRPEQFPDPERFDPDRFSSESKVGLSATGYMPFGAGRRICIGNHYAMLSGHLILATIAHQVRFSTSQRHIDTDPQVTLRPKQPITLTVTVRSRPAVPVLARPPAQVEVPTPAVARCPFHAAPGARDRERHSDGRNGAESTL